MTVTLDLDASSTDSRTRHALNDISSSVAKCKKILVITGAGISCSCGIPDFRSSDGLYELVKKQYPDAVLKGRELFEASLFRDPKTIAMFYTFIAQLKHSIDNASPSPTHGFIKTLDAKKKLLRSYTQNIDGFEEQVGLPGSSCQDARNGAKGNGKIKMKDVRNIQLHGDIHRVRCMACSAEYPCTQEHLSYFSKGIPPSCSECLTRSDARAARSARPIKVGQLRPAIVLYGETHPLGDEIGTMQTMDISRKPDMLIIMGTSLKVHGLKKMVKDFARVVHDSAPVADSSRPARGRRWAGKVIFVNKTPPPAEWAGIIDYHIAGDTDAWTTRALNDWKKSRPADFEIQQTLVATDGDVSMSSPLKVVKETLTTSLKAKRKGKAPAAENKRPSADDMVLSTPNMSRKCVTPSSPGKRRRRTQHYSDLESSPSKRRIFTFQTPNRSPPVDSERCMFSESTNRR
ncbi:DHS-like NAD/FAD-binding domain containing protein [Amanita muscaria]